jgi:hypothetical protein
MKRDRLDDAVALVEDAEHRDALRHRRDAALPVRSRCDLPGGRGGSILLLRTPTAGRERERKKQRCSESMHCYSGIQGS